MRNALILYAGEAYNVPKDDAPCWEVLGIDKDASTKDIHKAYRRLCVRYHPDKPTGNLEAFHCVKKAFERMTTYEYILDKHDIPSSRESEVYDSLAGLLAKCIKGTTPSLCFAGPVVKSVISLRRVKRSLHEAIDKVITSLDGELASLNAAKQSLQEIKDQLILTDDSSRLVVKLNRSYKSSIMETEKNIVKTDLNRRSALAIKDLIDVLTVKDLKLGE